ncbi:MAG: ABC transporter permease [Candidatus Hodarchaeales archaeon]|jgi:peptide/nickel transport system permease protein
MTSVERSEFLDEEKLKELEKEKKKRRRVGRMMVFWRRFYRHKMGVFGLGVIVFITILGVLAPYIAGDGKLVPFDPREPAPAAQYLPPFSFEFDEDNNASQIKGGLEKTLAAIYYDIAISFTNGTATSPLTYPLDPVNSPMDSAIATQLSRIDHITANETGTELWVGNEGQFNNITGIITLSDSSFSGVALVDFRVGGKLAIKIRPTYDSIAGIRVKLKVQAESQISVWTEQLEASVYEDGTELIPENALSQPAVLEGYRVLTGGLGIRAALNDFFFPSVDFFSPGIKVTPNKTYVVVFETDLLGMAGRGVYQRLYLDATDECFWLPEGLWCDTEHITNLNWNAKSGWNTKIPEPADSALGLPGLKSKEEGWMSYFLAYYYTEKFHMFGTDSLGRDILSATIWGATASMSVAFLAQSIGIIIGVSLGAVSGYYGGTIDNILMRINDIFLSIPFFFLLLIAVAIWEKITLPFMAITIGLLGWSGTARIVRAQFLSLREMEYTEAARALGVQNRTIIFKHLLPNALAPVIVNETLGTAGVILVEAGLSFLGFGDPLAVSWGTAIQWGMTGNTLRFAPWVATIPGLAIFVVVIAFNLMGDALRDALDPRLR